VLVVVDAVLVVVDAVLVVVDAVLVVVDAVLVAGTGSKLAGDCETKYNRRFAHAIKQKLNVLVTELLKNAAIVPFFELIIGGFFQCDRKGSVFQLITLHISHEG